MSKGGRPSDYSPELAEKILLRLADGESLNRICKDDGMPSRVTVYAWCLRDQEFLNKYRAARDQQADSMVDDTQDIADNATSDTWTVARLQVQVRQWAAAKMAPRKYGERLDQYIKQDTTFRTVSDKPEDTPEARDAWNKQHGNGHLNGHANGKTNGHG